MRKVRRESRRRRSVSEPRMANLIGITSHVTRVLLALGSFEAHSAAACCYRSRFVVSHALASTSKCYVDRVERLVGALRQSCAMMRLRDCRLSSGVMASSSRYAPMFRNRNDATSMARNPVGDTAARNATIRGLCEMCEFFECRPN